MNGQVELDEYLQVGVVVVVVVPQKRDRQAERYVVAHIFSQTRTETTQKLPHVVVLSKHYCIQIYTMYT